MFKVCITFMDSMDEWGYPCSYYDFDTEDKALAFCFLKQAYYKDNDLVSVDLCF